MLLARTAGLDWRAARGMGDAEIDALLFRPPVPRSSHQQAPDFAAIHQELKRPGVTLMLLWEEYPGRARGPSPGQAQGRGRGAAG